MKLLVVEDYEPLRLSLVQGLTDAGYAVDATGDGDEAWWFLRGGTYGATVLDLMLPKRDGLSILRKLREAKLPTAVLLLTARDRVCDRVEGLSAGADDYLVKPFAFEELLARVQALLRRRYGQASPQIRVGPLVIDPAVKTVEIDGEAVAVTPMEFSILEALAYAAGRVVSRAELTEQIYRFDHEPDSNALNVHLSQLRRKLADKGAGDLIATRRGHGYVMEQGRSCSA